MFDWPSFDPCSDGRPEDFFLDPFHPYAQGLQLFLGGQQAGGAKAYDSSRDFGGGNDAGNHGTLTNMSIPATATSGWAWDNYLGRSVLRFDATNDVVILSNSLTYLDATNAWTIACWFKPTAYSTYGGIVQAGYAQLIQSGSQHLAATRQDYTGVANADASQRCVSAAVNGVYCHLGSTANGPRTSAGLDTNGKIYFNGIEEIGGFGSDNNYGVASSIGKNYASTNGEISDVMIYNRPLSAAEIAGLANPNNVMLSGLLIPSRRKSFAAAAAAAGTMRWPWQQRRHRRMAGAR